MSQKLDIHWPHEELSGNTPSRGLALESSAPSLVTDYLTELNKFIQSLSLLINRGLISDTELREFTAKVSCLNESTFRSAPLPSQKIAEHIVPVQQRSEECVICRFNYYREQAAELVCGHFFHRRCLHKWLKVSSACPVCRNNSARQ